MPHYRGNSVNCAKRLLPSIVMTLRQKGNFFEAMCTRAQARCIYYFLERRKGPKSFCV